jgi:hypothetical protein
MNSTSVLSEILTIGIGGLLGICLISFPLLGIKPDAQFLHLLKDNASILVIVGTPITYLVGIWIDRLADFCFEKAIEEKIKNKVFSDSKEYYSHFAQAQVMIYTKSVELSKIIEYFRSRKRVCRGWNINLFLILIGYFLSNTQYLHLSWKNAIILFILLVLIIFINYFSYINSVYKEYKTCKDYIEHIK